MTPRTQAVNQQIREERREEILAAAAKIFTYKGYAATRISDIAAAANVSHGLLYHYFKSKEEVYSALADRLGQSAGSIGQFAEQPGSPLEKLHMMLSMMLESVNKQPEYYILAIQAMTTEGVAPAVVDKIHHSGMAGLESIASIIEEGQRAGEIRPGDPREFFYLLYAVIEGLAINQMPSRHTRQPSIEIDAEVILRLIKA